MSCLTRQIKQALRKAHQKVTEEWHKQCIWEMSLQKHMTNIKLMANPLHPHSLYAWDSTSTTIVHSIY